MLEVLTERLGRTIKNIRGQGRLSDDNIKDTLREVRMALLEADVALPVVKNFITRVREAAQGEEVIKSLTPGQVFVKIVNDELVAIMGEANVPLALNTQPPAVILMAGLQGAGKTTSAAKLALHLKQEKKSVCLVSCDVYRPAAIKQLQTLAKEIDVDFFASTADQKPTAIASAALDHARRQALDVVIVDTAGRLAIDEAMMAEIKALHEAVSPIETLFVVDSMTGQDAAVTAKAFSEALPLTGVILTKMDGDARGGAALSVREVTGKPIKFLGMGEKTDALQPFHPERMASRILGMGDVLSLVEQAQKTVDHEQAEKLAKKLKKGQGFDFEDFRDQLRQMQKMGGVASLMDNLPGMSNVSEQMKGQVNDKEFLKMEAIINSMTPHERRMPAVIKGSRRRRIALGSGTQVQDVNRLLKQFTQMQKMMKKFKKGGMSKMLKRMAPGMRLG